MNITCICTGNTCRSPMAQALLAQMAKHSALTLQIDSAGLTAQEGQPAAENAVQACKEQGIDLNAHRSKRLSKEALSKTDLFAVMTMSHAKALLERGVKQDAIYILNVPDPFGGNLEAYRQCRDDIKAQLIILLEMLKRQEQSKD